MPVLPLVGSTTTPPGPSRPLCSAASIIARQLRPFTGPPGFICSASASPRPRGLPVSTRRISISGVSPTRSSTEPTTRGCRGKLASNDIRRALLAAATHPELLAAMDHVLERDLVEALLDRGGEVPEDARRRVRRSVLPFLVGHDRDDGPFERAEHVADADPGSLAREVVPPARPALGREDAGLLEVLEDLLEEARGDQLTLGDLADLRRPAVVVKGDVEQRAHPVAAFVRQ